MFCAAVFIRLAVWLILHIRHIFLRRWCLAVSRRTCDNRTGNGSIWSVSSSSETCTTISFIQSERLAISSWTSPENTVFLETAHRCVFLSQQSYRHIVSLCWNSFSEQRVTGYLMPSFKDLSLILIIVCFDSGYKDLFTEDGCYLICSAAMFVLFEKLCMFLMFNIPDVLYCDTWQCENSKFESKTWQLALSYLISSRDVILLLVLVLVPLVLVLAISLISSMTITTLCLK